MKILVLSDSHSSLRFMKRCVEILKPNTVVHLGDHYDDAAALAEEYSHVRFHMLPGNCDRNRCPADTPLIFYYSIGGVKFYMTHGHLHGVKSGLSRLLADAREKNVQAVLYGDTHIADCRQEIDLWIVNPGSCRGADGSVAVIETDGSAIVSCEILQVRDLEERI